MNDNDQEDSVDDPTIVDINDLFPFTVGEKELIDNFTAKIRASLTTLTPVELKQMATVLFALESLPYATAGIYIDLAATRRSEEIFSYVSMEISDCEFRLTTGESVYSPGVGSDSHSQIVLEMEVGGFRRGTTQDFEQWVSTFFALGGSYSFEGNGDDDVDLTEEVQADGWDRLAAYWDSQGEDVYSY